MAGRTIAIGDIHGCLDALNALLDAVRPDQIVRGDSERELGQWVEPPSQARSVAE